jgi:hypothetical protein
VRIEILPEARDDLIAGFRFYERQAPGRACGLASCFPGLKAWPLLSLPAVVGIRCSLISFVLSAIRQLLCGFRSPLSAIVIFRFLLTSAFFLLSCVILPSSAPGIHKRAEIRSD